MSSFLLYIAIVLLCLSLFPWKEGFVSNPTLIESIVLTKNLPITKLQIEYAGALMTTKDESWLNLCDLTILDINGKTVEYWKGGNTANFLKGNKGYMNKIGPIENLWDDKPDTLASSSVTGETLVITFGNSMKLDSIMMTNRNDSFERRIANYNLVLYNNDEIIGTISLSRLGVLGKTVKYKVVLPEKGPQGDRGESGLNGKDGLTGPQGSKGDRGEPGPQGRDGLRGQTGKIGPPGDRGELGPQGKDGIPGPIGDTNTLFYQIPLTDVFHSSTNSEKP